MADKELSESEREDLEFRLDQLTRHGVDEESRDEVDEINERLEEDNKAKTPPGWTVK